MPMSARLGRRHRRRRLHRPRCSVAHFREIRHAPFRAVVRRREMPPRTSPPGAIAVRDLATATEAELDAVVAGATRGRASCGTRARDAGNVDRSGVRVSRRQCARDDAAGAGGHSRPGRALHFHQHGQGERRIDAGRAARSDPDDPPAPHDAYARSKLEAERELLRLAAGTTLDPVILRLPLVYGPGVAGNFLALEDEIARGHALPLGAIRNRRSVLGVGNLVEAIDAALDAPVAPRGVHFIADAESVSVPELTRAIAASLGVEARLRPVPVPLLRLAGWLSGRRAIDRSADGLARGRSVVVHRGDRMAAAAFARARARGDGERGGGFAIPFRTCRKLAA